MKKSNGEVEQNLSQLKTMARTKPPKGREPMIDTPLSQHQKSPLECQLICHKFWVLLECNESKTGWDLHKTPNSVSNWQLSACIQARVNKGSFLNVAKVSVVIKSVVIRG